MPFTVVNLSQQIFNCDSDGMDGGTGVLDEDFEYEGTGCLGLDTDIETNYAWYSVTQVSFVGRHYQAALMCLTGPTMDIKANGGYQLCLEDSSGNQGYWYVAGSDTHSGAWKRFIIDCDSTPTSNNGTNPTITAITKVGIGFKGIAKSKLSQNTFWDDLRYDTSTSRGISISGGTVATPEDLDELLVQDIAGSIGQITKVNGVFFLQGTFNLGHATADLYLTDKNQLIVFENDLVADGYHKIIADCGTGTTEIFFGELSGSDGIKGCVFKSGGTVKFQFDMSDTNIDKLGIYGCNFQDAGTITFQLSATNKEVLNPTMDSCAEVIPNTIKFENFNIISSDGLGIRMIPNHGIKNGKIIAPGSSGINIVPTGADQTFSIDNILFSGADGISTYDLYSNTIYDLTASKVNGSNPTHKNEAGTGTITITGSVPLTINVKDEDGNPIENAQTSIQLEASPFTQLMNEDTTALGIATENYSGATGVSIVVKVRKSETTDNPRYFAYSKLQTIGTSGLSLNVTLKINTFI